ncbi:hypothetical protein PoB_002698400 [Plakobranchus ocellatus]|uniref:Uncharacterized protein n=1 Tax=Plakobranchus ocellatus TaxID=259542 RepID=A0AAV4A2P6_9GAST|nr:hypothetical protein PoB_002698400 [Plakobranchus ocellatus]
MRTSFASRVTQQYQERPKRTRISIAPRTIQVYDNFDNTEKRPLCLRTSTAPGATQVDLHYEAPRTTQVQENFDRMGKKN